MKSEKDEMEVEKQEMESKDQVKTESNTTSETQ